jgi:cytochrome P450
MAVAKTPNVSRPAHVSESLVYDFDMRNDPGLMADPHKRILDLIQHAPPIFWTPHHGGHWVFLSHAANFKAARDPETFSSSFLSAEQVKALMREAGVGGKHIPTPVPINLDPPQHTKYRLPLQSVFSPKAINALKDDIRTLAAKLIDDVAPQGRCEFMSTVAEQLPVTVFMKMMGLPLDRFAQYRALVKENMAATTEADIRKPIAILQRVAESMRDIFIERRDNPKNDLISLLWKIEVDGKRTIMDDMDNYGVLLFVAGLDTVMQGMGHGVRYLAGDLAVQQRLRQEPALIPEAVEEILRRYTFTVPARRVARDTVFEGVELKVNDRVMLYLPAADLDPREFSNPERFNLDRENKTHIAFNAGPHRCLGSHLARIEIQILFEEMLKRLPEFRLDPGNKPNFHGGNVISIESMHLVWTK